MFKDIVGELNDLIQLDLDAVKAYDQAIEACESQTVRSKLTEFKQDHERHVADLSLHVSDLGGTPAERGDFKGMLIEGFTAIMSQNDHGALLAMRGNEELTTRKYKAALEIEGLPTEVRMTVERNFSDEQRHLTWVKEALDLRVWERPSKAA